MSQYRASSAATSIGRSPAIAARDGSTVDLTRLSAEGAGLTLNGAGQLTEAARRSKDSCIYRSPTFGPSPASSVIRSPALIELAADAAREGAAGFKATLHGSTKELRTGIAVGDALLGGAATLTGSLYRDAAGTLTVDQLAIAGAAVNLSGDATV